MLLVDDLPVCSAGQGRAADLGAWVPEEDHKEVFPSLQSLFFETAVCTRKGLEDRKWDFRIVVGVFIEFRL
jgi:hypothetical protein